MKAYKLEVLIVDHDEIGEETIVSVLENHRYPNRCIAPDVKNVECADIGEWHDDHPLNLYSKSEAEYKRLFNNY